MEFEEYRAFTAALQRRLEADPRVLGLVAVGSMAELGAPPDAWSDHDFFVVVPPGVQEELRGSVAWLPDHDRVVYRFRETAHGVKVLYGSGHLLEYAVFDPDELYLARVDRYRVIFDRADVARRMAEVARATGERQRTEAPGDAWLMGQLLASALVGYGRWQRGERLSARELLGHAVTHLVRLLARYSPGEAVAGEGGTVPASINPLRRFERAHGALGDALDEILARPVPAAAAGLLDLARQELSPRMPDFPAAALEAVRGRMG